MINVFQMLGAFFVVIAVVLFFVNLAENILLPGIGWLDDVLFIPLILFFGLSGGALMIFGPQIEKAVIALALLFVGIFLFQRRGKSSGGKR